MSRSSWWLLALLCTACQGPETTSSAFAQVQLVLPRVAAPFLAVGPQGTPRPGAPAPTSPAVPTPQAPTVGPTAGGFGGSGGGAASAPTPAPTSFVVGPGGVMLPVSPSEAIALPSGLTGEWSLFSPGDVPATIAMPSGAVTLHPSLVDGTPAPSGVATIAGTLAQALGGLDVQYLSRGRRLYAGATTKADGSFSFNVPADAAESGLVVARDLSAYPRVGLASVTLTPGATTTVDALALATPQASPAAYRVEGLASGTAAPAPLPTPPAGLALSAGELQVAMTDAQGPWRATVLLSTNPELPSYALPGFTLVDTYDAASADGAQHAETSGPPGQVPAFLAPPDLTGLPAGIGPGGTLSWPAVTGATLYTLTLTPANQATMPVWEGASAGASLTLPASLSLAAQALTLQVDAWDAPGVDIYSVASLRALRVPDGPQGASGRHSWSRRTLTWTP